MALLQFHFTIAPPTASLALNHHQQPLPRFCKGPFAVHPKPSTGCRLDKPFALNRERSAVIAKASEGAADSVGPEPSSEKAEESSVSVEKLPLESKVQMHLEQRLKMKLAKKLRLRRKRLVRKRHLRKKGRWPPSKMKKNKNV